jgi:hypothetical protein
VAGLKGVEWVLGEGGEHGEVAEVFSRRENGGCVFILCGFIVLGGVRTIPWSERMNDSLVGKLTESPGFSVNVMGCLTRIESATPHFSTFTLHPHKYQPIELRKPGVGNACSPFPFSSFLLRGTLFKPPRKPSQHRFVNAGKVNVAEVKSRLQIHETGSFGTL